MPIKQPLTLGDFIIDEEDEKTQSSANEFRDSLQIILDKLYEVAHDEPTTNLFEVSRNVSQLDISGSTPTKIIFNTLKQGDIGEFDLPNGRFKPNVLGNYQILATVELPTLPTSENVYLAINKNGLQVWKGAQSLISASVAGIVNIETLGDFIEIVLVHSDGFSHGTTATQSKLKFAGFKIP